MKMLSHRTCAARTRLKGGTFRVAARFSKRHDVKMPAAQSKELLKDISSKTAVARRLFRPTGSRGKGGARRFWRCERFSTGSRWVTQETGSTYARACRRDGKTVFACPPAALAARDTVGITIAAPGLNATAASHRDRLNAALPPARLFCRLQPGQHPRHPGFCRSPADCRAAGLFPAPRANRA